MALTRPGKTSIQLFLYRNRDSKSILKAALVNILNPGLYLLDVGHLPILLKAWREIPVHGIGFMAGFYLTMIFTLVTIILIFGTVRQLGPKINRILLGVSALALFCFGLYQLWLGIID
jgi:threonine/homoserine/homoserine lactone efflux protein